MLQKIKKSKTIQLFNQLSDVRALGLLVFGGIVLLVTWSGIKAVQTNYELQKQIASLEQENKVSELQNQNLKLKNQYLNTDQFLELAARRQFGLAAPGEKVMLIPKNVALSHTIDLEIPSQANTDQALINRPTYQKNFQAWIDFFLHRPTVEN